MQYEYIIIQTIFILLACWLQKSSSRKNCWTNQNNDCLIEIELLSNYNKKNDQIQINCTTTYVNVIPIQQQQQQQHSIILNGCQTTFDYDCCGLELLQNCHMINEMLIQYFQMNVLRIAKCHQITLDKSPLNKLYFHHNDIGGIDLESFTNYFMELQVLEFQYNSLYYIIPTSFKHLKSLNTLRILDETELAIKDKEFLLHIPAAIIHLESLKLITANIFRYVSGTLKALTVINVTLDQLNIHIKNNGVLCNLTIINCGIETFNLRDHKMTLKLLNLKRNHLKSMDILTPNNIEILDLSENSLIQMPHIWLKNLTNLKELILKKNHINMLDLHVILTTLPHIRNIDIRENDLNSLQGLNADYDPIKLSQVQLESSKNPWSCSWLYKFAQQFPEIFRIMTFDKLIRKINVDGLECQIIYEKGTEEFQSKAGINKNNISETINLISSNNNNNKHNIMFYGNHPVELKRNQRLEALIIIFMLPMGIALLFLLLYMWIYCQKVFHLSYYRNVSCGRRKQNSDTNIKINSGDEGGACALISCNDRTICQISQNSLQMPCPFNEYKNCKQTANSNGSMCICHDTLRSQCDILEEERNCHEISHIISD